MTNTIIVNIIEPALERPVHPCLVGAHRFAWAQLARGGTVQVCIYGCGARR